MLKVVTVIGARPQFIKTALVSKMLRASGMLKEKIVHTGQHFDRNMSEVFFEELQIPHPDYNLNIHSLSHTAMIGKMMLALEEVYGIEKPDKIIVYGDTNSTLAAALAAKKMNISLVHIEAGLRSNNMQMPEEMNRILTDRMSDVLFCPTDIAVSNLKREGYDNFSANVINSGDVMFDASIYYSDFAKKPLFEIPSEFKLATIHRSENTDDITRLKTILNALVLISKTSKVIMPLHPRTRHVIAKDDELSAIIKKSSGLIITEPQGYLEIIYLLQACSMVITDSGGMQKESYFYKKPCLLLREETEWSELLVNGNVVLAGNTADSIFTNMQQLSDKMLDFEKVFFGNGKAAEMIAAKLINK